MSSHTKEAQEIKKIAIDKLLKERDKWLKIEKGGVKISTANKPKNYNRMARLIAGGKDSLYLDEIENMLSSDASADEIRNYMRTVSETKVPHALRRMDIEQMHHIFPVELMQVLVHQEPEVMLEFLQRAEEQGMFFSDDALNMEPHIKAAHDSTFERKTGKGKFSPAYELNISGDRPFSAHPQSTNKGIPKGLDRQYSTGSEMFEALKPELLDAAEANRRGVLAGKGVRDAVDDIAREAGLIKPGESIYELTQDPAKIQRVRKILKHPALKTFAVAQFNPYLHQDQELLDRHGRKRSDYDQTQLINLEEAPKLFPHVKPGELTFADGILRFSRGVLDASMPLTRAAGAAVPDTTDIAEAVSTKTGGQIARGEYLEAAKDVVTEVGGNIVSNIPVTAPLMGAFALGAKTAPALTATAGGALGLAMLPLTVATTMNAGKNLYSGYLKEKTGSSLGGHVSKFHDKQDGIKEAAKALNSTGPNGPMEVKQGETNPIKRFVNEKMVSRGKLFNERFNPLEGEFGISELFLNR